MTTKHTTGRAADTDGYATPEDLTERWPGTTRGGLAQQRYLGRGPKFVKIGRRVLYRWADVYAYEEANTHERTA